MQCHGVKANRDAVGARLEVQWPGGGRESIPGGPANRLVTLRQGTGAPGPVASARP